MSLRTFAAAERRARLVRRHRLGAHRTHDLIDAVDAVVCLHATDPATVYLSAWARVDGLDRSDVDAALYAERTLVKHLAMRRTLFVLRSGLFDVVQAAASQRVADQQARRLAKDVERARLTDDGAAWLRSAELAATRVLQERDEATATEVREAAPELDVSITYAPDKSYSGAAPLAPRVLTVLSAKGLVVRARNRGPWHVSRPTWALTEKWLGPREAVDERAARAELVRRWLRAFGPATRDDLQWWLGATVTAVRTALADVSAVEVDLDGRPGIALADDLDREPEAAPGAFLLPGLDATTMGWAQREWYLGEHRVHVFDRNGNAGPTAWWDGRVVGGWVQTQAGEVRVQLLEDVGAEGGSALEREAARLTEWLGGQRISPRFPSPLSMRPPGSAAG